DLIPHDKITEFVNATETIGAIMIWPSNRIGQMTTINGERGFNRKISDRLDLTIECIKRYYLGIQSPLFEVFKRYANFFSLFEDFRGYIDFFLLQDAVSADYSFVRISKPFDNFSSSPIPNSIGGYLEYVKNTTEFVKARNKRIERNYSIRKLD
ncbi:MAG: DUF6994 family protein, partial [Patescibacteria group bacterium]